MVFKKAKKEQAKLRLALSGPSGSGKTYTALTFAKYIGKKIAVIDTEGNSASKYANLFDFDVVNLTSCHPKNFIQAIDEACKYGYDVLIIDSLSHAWNGKDGILELADREKLRISNKFQVWGKISPLQTEFTNKLITAPINIISTLRVKTAYDMQEDDNGKKKPVKIGLAPVQKEGIEYEFDILAEMTPDNTFIVAKTRCPELNGYIKQQPGQETAEIIKAWLSDGVPAAKDDDGNNGGGSAVKEEEPAQVKAEPKKQFSVQTSAPKKEEEPVVSTIKNGVWEETGILDKIVRKDLEQGPVWGFILKGAKLGFRHFSEKAAAAAEPLIGKQVICKVLGNENGYTLLSIKAA